VREKPECPLCRRAVAMQHVLPLRVWWEAKWKCKHLGHEVISVKRFHCKSSCQIPVYTSYIARRSHKIWYIAIHLD
jgi:hypothetical protein